jgi:hypothetical protein
MGKKSEIAKQKISEVKEKMKPVNEMLYSYGENKEVFYKVLNTIKAINETWPTFVNYGTVDKRWKETEDKLTFDSVKAICNVLSYYLLGKVIGKVPPQVSFSQYFISELRKGHIGMDVAGPDIKGIYYGVGSMQIRTEWGLQGVGDNKNKLKKEDIEGLNKSGVKVAIAHRFIPSTHFYLIVKDSRNEWRNMDHSANPDDFERRGGLTNFNSISQVVFKPEATESELKAMSDKL